MFNLWLVFLYQPLVNGLIFFYQILGQNMGWAIVALTGALRLLLLPLTTPSLKAAQKMRQLQPELERLKKKHQHDKQALAQAQLKLYRDHGANPAAGCVPWLIQIVVLLALFKAFNQVLAADGNVIEQLNQLLYPFLRLPAETILNTHFFYLDLTKPDVFVLPFDLGLGPLKIGKIPGIFLLAAALVQFLSSKSMMPAVKANLQKAKQTPKKEDDMAYAMQQQMLYLMPVMTVLFGFTFPSGLVVYWLALSLVMWGQQVAVNAEHKGK